MIRWHNLSQLRSTFRRRREDTLNCLSRIRVHKMATWRHRLYAIQASAWIGQVLHRPDDGGKNWETVCSQFVYDGIPGNHQWYDFVIDVPVHEPDTVYVVQLKSGSECFPPKANCASTAAVRAVMTGKH